MAKSIIQRLIDAGIITKNDIDKYAFWMCENLEPIDLDIQHTKIHWTAFMHCPNWIKVSTILQGKSKAGEKVEWYH